METLTRVKHVKDSDDNKHDVMELLLFLCACCVVVFFFRNIH